MNGQRAEEEIPFEDAVYPGSWDIKEAIVRNWCIRWRTDRVVFEADQAHFGWMLETTRKADCKANTDPATGEEHPVHWRENSARRTGRRWWRRRGRATFRRSGHGELRQNFTARRQERA